MRMFYNEKEVIALRRRCVKFDELLKDDEELYATSYAYVNGDTERDEECDEEDLDWH